MSTNLQDLSPIPLPEDKPSNRGRFSDDRQYWEELHKRRYPQWQGGDGRAKGTIAENPHPGEIRFRLTGTNLPWDC